MRRASAVSGRTTSSGRSRTAEQALAVYTREAFPGDWAMTQSNLASAYRDAHPRRAGGQPGAGDRSTTSRRSRCIPARPFREDWAMTQNNLANAYQQRIRGERADNLERAIAHSEQALTVYTREAFPEDWAMTQNNLAARLQPSASAASGRTTWSRRSRTRAGAHGLSPARPSPSTGR